MLYVDHRVLSASWENSNQCFVKIDETSRNVKFYVQENQFTLSFLKIFSPSVVAFAEGEKQKRWNIHAL